MASTATLRRQAAIQRIIDMWQDETGEFVADPDFTKLHPLIWELRKLGRSEVWQRGVEKFADTAELGRKLFADQYPNGYLPGYNEVTYEGKREYCRLFRWALLQGAIYANSAA